jgi:hypothetical protein
MHAPVEMTNDFSVGRWAEQGRAASVKPVKLLYLLVRDTVACLPLFSSSASVAA